MRIRWFAVVVVLVSAFWADGAHAAGVSVAGSRAIEIDRVRIIAISPDSSMIAGVRRVKRHESLCTFNAETLTEIACADLSGLDSGLRIEDVVWSPDSTRIAFAEEAFLRLNDGDIWLMDARTGTLTDLTDEGVRGRLPILNPASSPIKEFFMDVAPAWSPDSERLVFSRSIWRDGEFHGTQLATIPAAGGEVTPIVQITDAEPGVVFSGIRWQADGSRIFYSVIRADRQLGENGIWVVNADGSDPRQIASSGPDTGPLTLSQLTPDGGTMLGFYPMLAGQGLVDRPVLTLIDTETGSQTPVTAPANDSPGYAFVGIAALSPDGSTLLYVVRLDQPDHAVYARTLATGEDTDLEVSLSRSTTPALGMMPVWTAGGAALINVDTNMAMLLSIEGGRLAAEISPVVPVATPVATPSAGIGTGSLITVDEGGAELYAAPDTGAPVVRFIPSGTSVEVISDPVLADGESWWPVMELVTRTIGWLRESEIDG